MALKQGVKRRTRGWRGCEWCCSANVLIRTLGDLMGWPEQTPSRWWSLKTGGGEAPDVMVAQPRRDRKVFKIFSGELEGRGQVFLLIAYHPDISLPALVFPLSDLHKISRSLILHLFALPCAFHLPILISTFPF